MPTAIPFIPVFAVITLLLGGTNELSIWLILVGILSINIHAALPPADPSSPFPNFDNYHPQQPPFRDYMLVFGLASLMLVALISRTHRLFWSLVPAIRRKSVEAQTVIPLSSSSGVQRSSTDRPNHLAPQPRPTPSSASSASPSHTFTDQWTTTVSSTLADASPARTIPLAVDREATGSSEIATLKTRVFRLETALEEMNLRLEALSAVHKGTDVASGITTTLVAESSPSPPHLNTTVPLPTPTPSPPPVEPNSIPKSADVREHLRSLVEFVAEGTRQTDQLILKMRNILAEADADDDDDNSSVSPSSRSTQSLSSKYFPTSSSAIAITPSPSPSLSPSLFLSPSSSRSPSIYPEILRSPTIRRVRDAHPFPPVVSQAIETTGTSRNPDFNPSLDLSGISKVSCSTPVRSAKGTERSTSPSRSSFLNALRSGVDHQGLFTKPASKYSAGVDTAVRPVNRLTSILSGAVPRSTTLRSISNPLSRLRERSSKTLSPFPSRFGAESLPDSRRNVKAERKTVRILDGASGWLAEHRRRKTESPQEFCPLHRDCRR